MKSSPCSSKKTWLLDPISSEQLQNCRVIKEYSHKDVATIQIFQSIHNPALLFYGLSSEKASAQLELEGVSDLARKSPQLFLRDAFAKITRYSPGEYKLSLSHRGQAGGWGEVAAGVGITAAGVGIAAVGSLVALPAAGATAAAVAASTVMGGGAAIASTGWSREEDEFDEELLKEGLKGALSGAVTGVLGGGMGGALVKKIGAKTVLAKQSIHAATNALGGIFKNFTEAKAEEHFGGKEGIERAKKKLSKRNLVASALGGAAGGLAGAHVGKQVSKISGNFLRAIASSFGGAAAGGATGAAAGAAGAVAVNVCEGKKATEGLSDAAKNGGSTGMIIGALSANRVCANDLKVKEEQLAKSQLANFEKEGVVQLNPKQTARLQSFVEKELKSTKRFAAKLDRGSSLFLQEQQKIQQLKELLGKIREGTLDKEGLFFLNTLGGLNALDNEELITAIQQSIKEALPPPQPSSIQSVEEPNLYPQSTPSSAKPMEKPSDPTYRPKRLSLKRHIQDKFNEIDRAAENTAKDPLSQLRTQANEKMKALLGMFEEVRSDPESLEILQRELGFQKLTKQLLQDPSQAASSVLEQVEKLRNSGILSIPVGTQGEAAYLYRKGSEVFLLKGISTEELQGSEHLAHLLLEKRGFDMGSQLQKERLYSQVQELFSHLQQEQLQAAQAENALPSLPTHRAERLFSSLFSSSELDRLQPILDHLEGMLSPETLTQWTQDLDALNNQMAAELHRSRVK